MSKQLAATAKSVIEVEGAVRFAQQMETVHNGDMRVVTSTWYAPDGGVLRQDQTVLVDKLPSIDGAA